MLPAEKNTTHGRNRARPRSKQTSDDIAHEQRKLKGVATTEEEIGRRIKSLRENLGMTQAELTQALDYSRAAAAQWERGESLPPLVKFGDMARKLKTRPEFIAFGIDYAPIEVMPDPDKMGFAMVNEVVFQDDPDKPTGVMPWALPYQYLRAELNVEKHDALCMYKVQVDTPDGKYQFGDRVIIDRSAQRPSPPGHFLIWDGYGAQLAHVTVVPGGTGKPQARVQTAAGNYEVDAAKLKVIGRVRGRFMKA